MMHLTLRYNYQKIESSVCRYNQAARLQNFIFKI